MLPSAGVPAAAPKITPKSTKPLLTPKEKALTLHHISAVNEAEVIQDARAPKNANAEDIFLAFDQLPNEMTIAGRTFLKEGFEIQPTNNPEKVQVKLKYSLKGSKRHKR